MKKRKAIVKRETRETQIRAELDVDGSGSYEIETGLPFFNHMLELFAKHSLFDLRLQAAPRFGQPVPARLACKQGRAHVFFQPLNPPRHRGVVHAQAARGTYQRACAREFKEVTQVVPIHGGAPPQ